MATMDLCTAPAGYSQRAYNGDILPDCHTHSSEDDLRGHHTICPANCRINYYWPRNGTGGPSYARIDTTGTLTSTPDWDISINGSWNSANYSWGTATIGIGDPGVGDAFLVGPRIYVGLLNDDDTSPFGPKVYGVFVNAAGTSFSTPIFRVPETNHISPDYWSLDTTIRQYISNSTGYVVLGNGTSRSVALSGDFSGTYSRWESRHSGGGGSSSNNGGSGEGRVTASGAITSIRISSAAHGPTVGFIGFGAF